MTKEKLERAFGKAIRELRLERGLSQEKLLKLSDHLDRSTFQRYDSGKRVPKVEMIIHIAKALDVTPGYLVDMAYKYYVASLGDD